MTKNPRHGDALLQRVALGELPIDAPEVRALASEDEEFRASLHELVELQQDLEELGSDARADLTGTAATGHGPGESNVPAIVRGLAGRTHLESPRARWRPVAWLAAAAAVVLLTVWRPWSASPPPAVILGGSFGELAPSGSVDDFSRFEWEYELETGGYFTVHVFDGDSGAPIGESPELDGASWTPAPESRAEWPERIRWEVHVYTALGTPADSAEARAER